MAAANKVARLIVGQGGFLSTPAVSNLIRKRLSPDFADIIIFFLPSIPSVCIVGSTSITPSLYHNDQIKFWSWRYLLVLCSLWWNEWGSTILRNSFMIGIAVRRPVLVKVLLVSVFRDRLIICSRSPQSLIQDYESKENKFGKFVRKGFIVLAWRRDNWEQWLLYSTYFSYLQCIGS